MERKPFQVLRDLADVYRQTPRREAMSRRERLQRWAEVLGRQADRQLQTLYMTEYLGPECLDSMRCDNSPISVAFADPVLREEGLANDTYGEAKRFFDLSDYELHCLVCYCRSGMKIPGYVAAHRVQSFARSPAIFRAIDRAIQRWLG